LPLYEYRCRKCRKHYEKIQKFSDPPLKTCDNCGGSLERLVSAPAIQFKGSGWYVTDYAKKSSSNEAKKSEEKPAAEAKTPTEPAKATKSSDTKPSPKK
jgi:putative FmdB family regulatory protein